jgi:signal transduction histidine kinase
MQPRRSHLHGITSVRAAAAIAGAALLVALLGYLYQHTRPVDEQTLLETASRLRELKALDARWDVALARDPASADDPGLLDAYGADAERLLAALRALAGAGASPIVAATLPALAAAFAEKAALTAELADARRDALAAADPQAAFDLVGALRERLLLSTAGPRVDALAAALERERAAAQGEQQIYRVYLFYYAGALLVLLAYLGTRLASSYRVIQRMNSELRAANESLEDKVAERTRELSDANRELKETQAQLIQSEKMSSLGQLVAGIAHEINTPVAYVKNSLGSVDGQLEAYARLFAMTGELLAMLERGDAPDQELDAQFARVSAELRAFESSRPAGELRGLVRDGLYGIDQIAQLVAGLKDFSRLDRGARQRFDVHQGLDSTLLIARHLLKGIAVEKRYGATPPLLGAPSQLNQVFLNLVTNAAQAIEGPDGRITLTTGERDGEVYVSVADNGGGIAPEVLPKIFDPFFTTKPVGQGTGLGLSICYQIVEQHGGRIEVDSTPGRGTTFTVHLPVPPPLEQAA